MPDAPHFDQIINVQHQADVSTQHESKKSQNGEHSYKESLSSDSDSYNSDDESNGMDSDMDEFAEGVDDVDSDDAIEFTIKPTSQTTKMNTKMSELVFEFKNISSG